jgi:hypothetical protein
MMPADAGQDRGPRATPMSHFVVDDLADLAPWRAVTPNGAASNAITVQRGRVSRLGAPTMEIQATADAQGHRVERTLAAVDLTAFADLELWVRSDRAADGSEDRPFFLELRLGSNALAIGAGGNDWHRLIQVEAPNVWQPVPLALDDLPEAVRGALTAIRLTCLDASVPFTTHLDRILAVTSELVADVDAALLDRLGGEVDVGGTPAPAIVEPTAPPGGAFFRVKNYALRPAPERSPSSGTRTDHTEHGFSIRPASVPVDLFYAVEAVADERADAARLLEFALSGFAPRSTLEVAGRPLTVDWVDGPPLALPEIPAQPTVHLKIATSQRASGPREAAIPPFNRIDVEVDSRASA